MIENLILAHLIRDDEFTKRVLPFLQVEYFTSPATTNLFNVINDFVLNYKVAPTVDAIKLKLDQMELTGTNYTDTSNLLDEIAAIVRVDSSRRDWLIAETEQFCKHRALYLAISKSITIVDDDFDLAAGVPEIIKNALAVGFHTHIGHDYFADISSRYDAYHRDEDRVGFDIELLNKITGGGLTKKTLNIICAGTAVGKSLFLCHVAASTIASGKNVLYITMEMSEERIAHRIDANLLDVSMETVEQMSKLTYENAFAQMRKVQIFGNLIIKEYPTSTAHAGHFRALMDELAMKKNFKPDLLIVDYLNICTSSRFKMGSQTNSYTYVKSIAEELRGLAAEYDLPCLSATQFNREGFDNSDPSITNTSESFGLPQTADLQLALVTSEELEGDGLLMIKQLKNRYADMTKFRRFSVKCDRSKMKLSNDPNQQYLAESRAQATDPDPVSKFTPRLAKPAPNDSAIIF